MTREEIGDLLATLASVYERLDVTKETINGWFWVLEDADADAVRAAAQDWARSGKRFPPRPSELLPARPASEIDWAPYRRYAVLRRKLQSGDALSPAESDEYRRIEAGWRAVA